MLWGSLASDAGGVVLFLVWLVLPPLYTVVIGRHYARQCVESAQAAVWAREQLQAVAENCSPADGHCGEGES